MQKTTISRRFLGLLAVILTATACGMFLFSGSVVADHKGKPHGGGGGGGGNGGGGETGPQYVVVDLGSGGFGRAEGINNLGGVILSNQGSDELWELNASGAVQQITQLPGLDTQDSFAKDINDSFEVVGSADIIDSAGDQVSRGVLWRVDTSGNVQTIELPALPVTAGNKSFNYAKGISNNGMIAGNAVEMDSTNTTVIRLCAVVWDFDDSGQPFVLELPGGAEAWDVNSSGVVVGTLGGRQGALWLLDVDEFGELVASDPIPLPGLGAGSGTPIEITDGGRIAGDAFTTDNDRHAVVWTLDMQTGQIDVSDLGKPAGMDFGQATGVNDNGQAAGYGAAIITRGNKVNNEWKPFFFENGSLVELNDLIVDDGGLKELELPLGINDLGWICGYGVTRTTSNAFVVIPVPTSP